MDIENEIKEIKFRMNLLRENTEVSLFVYDSEVKEEQWESIRTYFREIDEKISKGETINSGAYESKILSFVGRKDLDYHFPESLAKLYWKNQQYEEIFEALYKDSPKFKSLFNGNSN